MQSSTPSGTQKAHFVITVTTPTRSTTRPPCACAGRAVAVYPGESEPMIEETLEQQIERWR